MAINVTWRNVWMLVGLLSALIAGMFGGTATMMEWRITAIQHQLSDRLETYHHEMDQINRRLDRLDSR